MLFRCDILDIVPDAQRINATREKEREREGTSEFGIH